MVNKHLPFPVRLVRCQIPDIELLQLIVHKTGAKSINYALHDAIDFYYDHIHSLNRIDRKIDKLIDDLKLPKSIAYDIKKIIRNEL